MENYIWLEGKMSFRRGNIYIYIYFFERWLSEVVRIVISCE